MFIKYNLAVMVYKIQMELNHYDLAKTQIILFLKNIEIVGIFKIIHQIQN
jgi:hypothetical protein